ncbi:DUF2971 domain-containing protein [Pseudomonas syringae]|uniref:DUF2971 domain-containing protein n=1 Tax=Pseudomonas syringae TaxID=317 RepID=UPI0023F95FC5|nr:DUF2971 domain-containing protein [Pseudomonas syringae]MDF5830535.1 DUF2971 domain-containing protein [Pseudomonas syringae]
MGVISELRRIILEEYDRPNSLKKSRDLVSGIVPKRLFKFRAVGQYSIENFREDTLFCAKADSFNDPFDCSLKLVGPDPKELIINALQILRLCTEERTRRISESDQPSTVLAEIVQELDGTMQASDKKLFVAKLMGAINEPRDTLNSKIRRSCNICSVTQRVDSLPMWAHYGDDHKGFAMEYDYSVLPIGHKVRESLWPVIYGDEMYDVTSQIFGRTVKEFSPLFLIAGAIHKSTDWRYEDEWRIVLPVGAENPEENVSVPTPVALYLGAQIASESAENLLDIARQKDIPVYRMEHSRTDFKMEPVEFFG